MCCGELFILYITFYKPAVFFNSKKKKKFPLLSSLLLNTGCLQRAMAV